MTKTLTEQWRDGELTEGFYYVLLRDSNDDIHIRYLDQIKYSVYFRCFKEVLAPVPSYDHFSQLVKKVERLELDSEAQDQVIQELKEQLKEANEVIKTTNKLSGNVDLIPLPYQDRRKVDGIYRETYEYLEKWGVK